MAGAQYIMAALVVYLLPPNPTLSPPMALLFTTSFLSQFKNKKICPPQGLPQAAALGQSYEESCREGRVTFLSSYALRPSVHSWEL